MINQREATALTFKQAVRVGRSLGISRDTVLGFLRFTRVHTYEDHHLHDGVYIKYSPTERRYYVRSQRDGQYDTKMVKDLVVPDSNYHLSKRLREELEAKSQHLRSDSWVPVTEAFEEMGVPDESPEDEDEESSRVDPYTYRDGHYFCYWKDRTIMVPEEKVEALYANYTKLGLGLDFETARLDAGLDPDEAAALRYCLHIVKNNIPFPPHLVERYGDDKLLEHIDEFKSERIKKKHIRRRMQQLERQADEQELRRTWLDARIEAVEALIKSNLITSSLNHPGPAKLNPEGPTVFWSMNDEHWGKQSINDSSYTLEDQYQEMVSTARRVVKRIESKRPKEIIMIFGSDMFNIDSVNMTTTRGTAQQNTASVGEIADRMMRYFIQAVNLATTIAPVKLYVIPGNHDRTITYFAGKLLETIFSTNDFVEVDAEEQVRKYHRCGSTLLTMIHGDIKPKDLTAIAYSEAAEKWPNQGFRRHVVIQGHLHRFDMEISTRSGTQTTTTTAASPKGGWEADRYGRVEDRRVTLYTIYDDEYISGVDFIEVG